MKNITRFNKINVTIPKYDNDMKSLSNANDDFKIEIIDILKGLTIYESQGAWVHDNVVYNDENIIFSMLIEQDTNNNKNISSLMSVSKAIHKHLFKTCNQLAMMIELNNQSYIIDNEMNEKDFISFIKSELI